MQQPGDVRSGPVLRELRSSLGLRQSHVAEALGVSTQAISQAEGVESGTRYLERRREIGDWLDRYRGTRGVSVPVEGAVLPGEIVSLGARIVAAAQGGQINYLDAEFGLMDWWTLSDPRARATWLGLRLEIEIGRYSRGEIVFFEPGAVAQPGEVVLVARRAGEEWEIGVGMVARFPGVGGERDWIVIVSPSSTAVQLGGDWGIIARAVAAWRVEG